MDILALFFILIFIAFLWFLSAHQKKRYAHLVNFLHANYSWFGSISFEIQHQKMMISNVGTGNLSTGAGGSYHKLKLEIDTKISFFLGPTSAYKYISISKIPDTFQKFLIQEREFIIHLENKEATELLKKHILQNQDLQLILIDLLKKDFQYLRSSSSMTIENFNLKRKYYFELSFIEHSCLENFDELQTLLRQFLFIAERLK